MELRTLLQQTLTMGGSDMFIIPGSRVMVKVNGRFEPITDKILSPVHTQSLISETYRMAGHRDEKELISKGDDDFSFTLEKLCRFRCNAYRQRGTLAATYRVVAFGLPDENELNIPEMVIKQADFLSGLILVAGAAGNGKSTTLACMIKHINHTRAGHIITIEDPIEYLHPHGKSLVSQREVPNDAPTFSTALRAALRQAPDVIMLGEMRDYDTMQTAITAAETGHLILSSLHTVGAAKTIDRIIDAFPPNQQTQIRIQLSMVLKAVISQRLVPTLDGEMLPVFEVMTVNSAIQTMIREGKTHQIDNVIYNGSAEKTMLSMDLQLLSLYKQGKIDKETAILYAINPEALKKRLAV